MSHFSVAVFTRDNGESVDELLAPFDENITVARYVAHTKEDLIQRGKKEIEEYRNGIYAEYLKDPDAYLQKCYYPEHFKYVSEEFPKKLNWTDDEIYADAIMHYEDEDIGENGEVYSTYNPSSKWDWYQIGGRFSGLLLLKLGENKEPVCDEDHCVDEALAECIDFDGMRHLKLKKLQSYEEFLAGNHFYKPEYVRALYPDEETYKMKMANFSTYAVITPDGEWHAPGEMGWFGCSSESPDDDTVWCQNYYERFIMPAIKNGWYITIVDCHI